MKRSRKEIRRRRKVWQSECNKKRQRISIALIIAISAISIAVLIIFGLTVATVYAREDNNAISIMGEDTKSSPSLLAGVTKVLYNNLGNVVSSNSVSDIEKLVINTESSNTVHNFKSTMQEEMEKQKAEDARVQEEKAKRQQELMNMYVYHPELPYTEADLEWLAKIVYCEAGGESSDLLQQYVASVVINRANAPVFSNTIEGVIFDKGQYAPAISGKIYNCSYDERSYANAKYVLDNGSILPENVLFQAEFTQGSGTYDTVPIRNGGATMYFCY